VLTYEFLCGEAPFEDTPIQTQRKIARCDMQVPAFVSAEARDLIKRVNNFSDDDSRMNANHLQLLVLDPEKRLSLDEVQSHPWIVKHCVVGERKAQRTSGSKDAGVDRK
jgi:aurora kinase